MKKIISFILVLTICFFQVSPAFAAEIETCSPGFNSGAIGILKSDDGEEYIIEGVLISSVSPTSDDRSVSATYDYAIPASIINGSTTVDSVDSGYESHVYLTVTYSYNTSPVEYRLTGVSGYWVMETYNTVVESASLNYACIDAIDSTQRVTGKSVSNNFSISTCFTEYTGLISGYVGASLTLNYLMGTSRRWSFTLTNTIVST